MEKLLFGTKNQANNWAKEQECITDPHPVAINLSGFQSEEGAPDTFSGETNALVARDEKDEVIAYLAFWE